MDDHLSKLKQLLETATLDDATRDAILETVAHTERDHSILKQRIEAERRTHYEMLNVCAFDIRSHLGWITGCLDLLRNGEAGELDDDQKRFMEEKASSEAWKLVALANDITHLSMSKLENGVLKNSGSLLDVCAFLDKMKERFDKTNMELVVHCPADIGNLVTDQVILERVLEYLFGGEGSRKKRKAIKLVVSRDAKIMRFAFTVHTFRIASDRLIKLYQGLVHQDWQEIDIAEIYVSAAYQLCKLLGGSLIVGTSPNGTVGFLLEFDAH